MSPVAMSALALPSGRISTTPVDGDAELGAQPVRLREHVGSRNTTCATPDASRRSMKMTPPWSRRRATQPANVTVWPASVDRNEPAA